MKRFLSLLLLVLLVASLTACSQQAGSAETPASAQAETQKAPAPTEALTPAPTPALKSFAPQDIFGSAFNPYSGADFPEYFNIYAASFSKGSAKLEGKASYTLSMTASGNTDDAIAFLTALAGLNEDEKIIRTDEYNGGGFCEFQGKDGATFTIRKTNPDDDRYEYVDGCIVDISINLTDADVLRYIQLVRDNFNINALAAAADYFDVTPVFDECDIAVNLHKKEARVTLRYSVTDVAAVQKSMAENVKNNWYDAQNGKMGLSYGIQDIEYQFDGKGGNIYVSETASDMKSVLSAYVEPEISFAKLGFQYSEKDQLCLYEAREPHYMSVAVCRPDWGSLNDIDGWNIEYLDEVNGYSLRITYNTDEDKYNIRIEKGKESAVFEYLPADKKFIGDYPDQDTVKRMFSDAFGTQGEDFYEKPMAYFEQLIQERFGVSVDELYKMPIR